MTSRLAVAVYRVEPPLAEANSTPDAVIGMPVLAHLIFVTCIRTDIIQFKPVGTKPRGEGDERDA